MADSILQAADHKECGPRIDTLSSESATYSSTELKLASSSSTADTTPALLLLIRSSKREPRID